MNAVRLLCVWPPDGRAQVVVPPWQGLVRYRSKMFEAKELTMLADAPIAAVAKPTGANWFQTSEIGRGYM